VGQILFGSFDPSRERRLCIFVSKIPKLYKNSKIIQKFQNYPKIPKLSKNSKIIQKFQNYRKIHNSNQENYQTPEN